MSAHSTVEATSRSEDEEEAATGEQADEDMIRPAQIVHSPARPLRARRPPRWFSDYEMLDDEITGACDDDE